MNDVQVREVLLVDDDEVSRELLMLFVAEAGFKGISAESGDEALLQLAELESRPYAVLADMQMHGITGNSLARELRRVCGSATRLIAMSGSGVPVEQTREFDGFLLKPFTLDQLWAAIENSDQDADQHTGQDIAPHSGAEAEEPGAEALNEAVYSALAKGMPAEQLLKLYGMCLEDAERRAELMRAAAAADDAAEYERLAHAIKGGCGMVGAVELAALASAMEENGPSGDGNVEAIEQFLAASLRLRRILDARVV